MYISLRSQFEMEDLAESLEQCGISYSSNTQHTSSDIKTWEQLRESVPEICTTIFQALGPFNLEATYQHALRNDLEDRGVKVYEEISIPISYNGKIVGSRRLDLLLILESGEKVIIELKATKAATATNLQQLEYYMAHFKVELGLLINFPHEAGFPKDHDKTFANNVLLGLNVAAPRGSLSGPTDKKAEVQIIQVKLEY